MGKANVSRQSLVEAIATLEAQRGLTDSGQGLENGANIDHALETVLQALRDKLAQIQSEPGDRKRHQLAVLVADLSGFTALSERMDVERVRDAINAMWSVLDAVIRDWGGQIEQHAGDSLLALFGLPQPRRGDAVRAVHAALIMQRELDLFNARVRGSNDTSSDSPWADDWPGPEMRIGIHSGPVYFARPGNRPAREGAAVARPTAVGDTVALARRLEELAPVGGVLVSETVFHQAQNQFHFQAVEEAAGGRSGIGPVYRALSERATSQGYTPGTVAGQVTRLVGRAEQVDRLELAFQAAADSHTPHLVTIVGPPGAGKSRLIHEFVNQAGLLAGSPAILRAGTQGVCPDLPYALARDLLLRRFHIRPQHSHYLIEAKIRKGLAELIGGAALLPAASGGLGDSLAMLERLLDARTAAAVPVGEALAVVGSLLRAVNADRPAIVILEGINRADDRSLELVDQLVNDPDTGGVLFLAVATARPAADLSRKLPWFERPDDIFSPVARIDVPPLSPVDSRLMATNILSRLSPPSMRLLDLVVAEAEGNPLYIESFVKLLLERGVITGGERWRVDMARAEASVLPLSLHQLTEARLAQLPAVEQAVLRHAAIFGPLCWDAALLQMRTAAGFDEVDIETALLSLEMQRYLVRDNTYSFGATQAYAFWRDTVREAAYSTIPPAERRARHMEVAHWLIANQNEGRFSAWFPVDVMIADHLAAAGDPGRADAWRQRANTAMTTGHA